MEAKMKRCYHRLALAAVTMIAVTGTAAAQQPGIFGVYDPSTGKFQPAPVQMAGNASTADVSPATATSRSGIIRVIIDIAIRNGTDPTTVKPTCYVGLSHSPSGHYYSQSESVQGTRVNNAGHCTAVLHYKWPKADTSQPVNFSLSVYVGSWSTSVPIDPISLPANGAVTVVNVDATL
jgi:hypothetical protein